MNKTRTVWMVLGLLMLLALGSAAEARIGGGRSSFGSRGSRGFGSFSNSQPSRSYQQPYVSPSAPQQAGMSPMGGTFTRGLMGGLAGGFLGSMLFRQSGMAGTGMPGSGGIGLLEIMLLAGVGFFLFRRFANRGLAPANGAMGSYQKLQSVEPGQFSDEETTASRVRMYDSGFDLASFKESRMDDFMRLQSAWNFRDLSSVASMVEPAILRDLNADINTLKNERQINRIENIAVRNVQLVDAWQEFGKEFTTLRFKANLVDYTVDETSGAVLSGDRVQPVKFEEDWTFVRDVSGAGGPTWKLSAIEN